MSEQFVQVPVSLLEEVLADMGSVAEGKLRALLSLPTLTADPGWNHPVAFEEEQRASVSSARMYNKWAAQQSAEPPRMEGLAPGTTFTACVRGDVRRTWFLRERGSIVATDGSFAHIAALDPSTIRDVTPPTDAA